MNVQEITSFPIVLVSPLTRIASIEIKLMAGKSSSPKKKTGRKSKKGSEGFPPILIGLIVCGLVCVLGLGIFALLPKNVLQQVSSAVPALKLPGRPTSHDEFLKAVVDAERNHARVMSSIKDKTTAQSALPQIKSASANLAKATNDWLEFISQHPLTADESQKLFLTRSNELSKIRKEFPYDIVFGMNPEILVELDNAATERKDLSLASMALTTQLNGRSMPATQAGPPQRQHPGGMFPSNQPPFSTPNPVPAQVMSTTPPEQPPEDVPIPENDLLKKYGNKGGAIRLVGLPQTVHPEIVAVRLMPLLGGGKRESQSIVSNEATFLMVGPVDDFDKLVQLVDPLGKVLKSDKPQGLIVLWVSPETASIPNLPPGLPPVFQPGLPR